MNFSDISVYETFILCEWNNIQYLRMNFNNYQNRQEVRKFWGIDLYAILKPSAKFKRNLFSSFEIIPLLIFGYLTCILMGKHSMKRMLLKIQCILIYQSLWKFTYKRMIYWTKFWRNFRKITSKFQGKSLKNRKEYLRYWQNSTRNKEKFMFIHNKNMKLLFLTTFRCRKKLF